VGLGLRADLEVDCRYKKGFVGDGGMKRFVKFTNVLFPFHFLGVHLCMVLYYSVENRVCLDLYALIVDSVK